VPARALALRGRRVLIVEHEQEVADLIARYLKPYEVRTEVVTSGEQALVRLRAERFDALTLDILMPGMSGFEVLRTIRGDPKLRGTPVVTVSVYSEREALAGEWSVSKPIDATELTDALGSAVLAGRTRVLVVARPELQSRLDPALDEMGLDHEWASSAASVAEACRRHRFEVALIDAAIAEPQEILRALDLRGQRLGRAVIVFSAGDESPGIAFMDADPVPLERAAAAVLDALDEPEREYS
jgi:CheY-like chemotaxis protein